MPQGCRRARACVQCAGRAVAEHSPHNGRMTMRRYPIAAIWACAALFAADMARADWRVWTLTETRRVLRDEPAGNGPSVRLAAARNEWESFQILMRSDRPVAGVRVEARDLAGPEGSVLRARDARLFRQHQLELTLGTHRHDGFKPGWYPDPLIPFCHPMTRQPLQGARLSAVPFDLPADETHGFWIDVNVPAGAKPGQYRGTYRVTADGQQAVEIPVTLTVWDFDLPRVSTLRTALGSPVGQLRGYYRQRAKDGKQAAPADWAAVEAQCAAMLSEHRVNATPPDNLVPRTESDGTFRIGDEQIDALRQDVDRYHVN